MEDQGLLRNQHTRVTTTRKQLSLPEASWGALLTMLALIKCVQTPLAYWPSQFTGPKVFTVTILFSTTQNPCVASCLVTMK